MSSGKLGIPVTTWRRSQHHWPSARYSHGRSSNEREFARNLLLLAPVIGCWLGLSMEPNRLNPARRATLRQPLGANLEQTWGKCRGRILEGRCPSEYPARHLFGPGHHLVSQFCPGGRASPFAGAPSIKIDVEVSGRDPGKRRRDAPPLGRCSCSMVPNAVPYMARQPYHARSDDKV